MDDVVGFVKAVTPADVTVEVYWFADSSTFLSQSTIAFKVKIMPLSTTQYDYLAPINDDHIVSYADNF
jgi:hypothetical protein